MEEQENKDFLYFIFSYYHSDLLYELFSDDEKGNDYLKFEKLEKLTDEFLNGNFDNEDEDVEDTTREFLINKIKKEDKSKIEKISTYEFLTRTNLIENIVKVYNYIPLLIEEVTDIADKWNYWSYSTADKSEIKDFSNIVLVEDIEKNKRFFELTPTDTF